MLVPHSDGALIFDIQRSSYVDGPGIRTTVFFKGCNLHCQWCHNPEGIESARQLMIDRNKCIHCGRCATICQNKPCILCGRCVENCPAEARKICGRLYDLAEVFSIIEQDKAFYDATGGGMTCSGGECMLQIDFLAGLLQRCHQAGISTAVDTAGCVPWEWFARILPDTDLFLYDIKVIDPDLHRRGTGADNKLILENYIRLVKHAKVWVRVPVINGFNADSQSMTAIADFLHQHPPAGIDLLPYHAMGEHKYEALGLKSTQYSSPSDEVMKAGRKMMQQLIPII